MPSKKDQELAVVLVFGFITLLAIIAGIILFFISMFRFLFWLSLIGILISVIFTIYFSFSWFSSKDNYWNDDDSGIFALISLGAIILLYIFAGFFYNGGYSESAIKTEMELRGYLEWYNDFTNIPNQAIEETINSLCKDPNYPCENTKKAYIIYKQVSGWKNTADTFSKILVTAKKVSKQVEKVN